MAFANMLIARVVLFAVAIGMSRVHGQKSEEELRVMHKSWMNMSGKTYGNVTEEEARFQIFKANYASIESFNNFGNKSYKLALNKFADLTQEEFVNSYTGLKTNLSLGGISKRNSTANFKYINVSLDAVPSSLDWSKKGIVTPVKDQGECGCCWAFAVAATVESITKLEKGDLIDLSEQQLLDCSTENDGCNGGLSGPTFDYIKQIGGVMKENNYPYKGSVGACNDKASTKAATISGYESVPVNNEMALLQAVANQPVSVSIDVRQLHFYSGGVVTGECGTDLNHELAAVGYGTESDGTQYWLMKNSWGTGWGEDGYLKIQRNVSEPQGICGIAMMATYPVA